MVRVVVDHALLAEAELAVVPAEGAVDDARDLQSQRLAQLLRIHQALAHEQEAHSLLGVLLHREDVVELLLGDVARAQQQIAETVLEPAGLGLRGHDLSAEERDRDRVVLALDREDAGLPLQAEHLEDVGQREDAKRSLKTHWESSSRSTAPSPRRRMR